MIKFWHNFWLIVIERKDFILSSFWVHVEISLLAIIAISLLGIPLGIVISRFKVLANPVLAITGFLYTIPVIAFFGFMIPLLGIGQKPAMVALFIYGLLPLVRNTYVGLNEVDKNILEAANGMGSTPLQRLFYIELPLALPVIIAGLRTVTVMTISIATIAAFIGAGGLGAVIWRGIASYNPELILAGSIPVALLAVSSDMLLGLIEKTYLKKFYGKV